MALRDPAPSDRRRPRQPELCVLTTDDHGVPALPFGPFDPVHDRTFEFSLRAFVAAQTGFHAGFVEQLYTFGDAGRHAPRATRGPERLREVSVGYLALTRETGGPDAPLDARARHLPLETAATDGPVPRSDGRPRRLGR